MRKALQLCPGCKIACNNLERARWHFGQVGHISPKRTLDHDCHKQKVKNLRSIGKYWIFDFPTLPPPQVTGFAYIKVCSDYLRHQVAHGEDLIGDFGRAFHVAEGGSLFLENVFKSQILRMLAHFVEAFAVFKVA